jgi:hypothetical protein
LAERFQKFADAFLIRFWPDALNWLYRFTRGLRRLWSSTPSLGLFFGFLADVRDQPGNADDSGDDDEDDVLIEVHAARR